jgi:quercetin dioxygenase-like cupin family protein
VLTIHACCPSVDVQIVQAANKPEAERPPVRDTVTAEVMGVQHSPDTLVRADGTWTTFTATTEHTGGDYVEVIASYRPRGPRPPLHLHPSQREDFEVLTGSVTVRRGDAVEVFGVGAIFETTPGTPHQMWNETDDEATVRWRTSPALQTERMFRELHALSQRGAIDPAARAELMEQFTAEYVPVPEDQPSP